MLISPDVIHVICLLMELVCTFIADASLQLFRYIHFTDTKEAVFYWSPGIKLHILYFILAVLFEFSIGIGSPLLLLLEPFVNHRINFICKDQTIFRSVSRMLQGQLLLVYCYLFLV